MGNTTWYVVALLLLFVILAGCTTQGEVMRIDLADIRKHEMQQRLNAGKYVTCR